MSIVSIVKVKIISKNPRSENICEMIISNENPIDGTLFIAIGIKCRG
jgi:hypothetical protein